MSDLIIEVPGPPRAESGTRRRKPGSIASWLDDLAATESEDWAKFHEPRQATYMTKIKNGDYKPYNEENVEVVTRRTDSAGERAPDGKVWLYARIIRDND
jgi:hypothetical protein